MNATANSGFNDAALHGLDKGMDELLDPNAKNPASVWGDDASLKYLNEAVAKTTPKTDGNNAVNNLPNLFLAQHFIQEDVGYGNSAVAGEADKRFAALPGVA